MLRFAEIGLFLVPFGVYAAWLVLGPRLPRQALWAAAALIAAMLATTVFVGLRNRMAPGTVYEPAHLENGTVVPGHAVPRPP